MKIFQTFDEFLVKESTTIPLGGFTLSLIGAAIMSLILSGVYFRYGKSLSNRRFFGGNFILISTTTVLLISIVKSSLALSLGLVGALSIVRFRAAIKEPEELAYLFLNIALGLGMGANQYAFTWFSFILISLFIIMRGILRKKDVKQNLFISFLHEENFDIENISSILKERCKTVLLKRIDTNNSETRATYYVRFNNFSDFNQSLNEIKLKNKTSNISFIEF